MINLLLRYYDPVSGGIYIDDVNTLDIKKNSLRKAYGLVLQDTWIFRGTVRENIAYAKPEATLEEVIEAAFAKATEDLKAKASSDDAEYSESLIKMIEEATEELGGGDLIVQVKESDVAKVEGHLKKLSADLATKTGVSTTLVLGEPIDAIGGAILKTRNGDIEVNNTIESRLDRFKGLLRSEVANVLFKN